MGKAVSISIEDSSIKVVYATLKGRRIIADDEIVLPREKLDEFLSREKKREFSVTVDFKSSYHDTFYIPPVRERLARALLVSELRKRKPVEGDVTPVFFKVGQKTVNGKRLDEFFVFSVSTPEINELVQKFLSKGKRIKTLYPNMLSVVKILPKMEEPYLCFYETGSKKNLFLMKNGRVLFVRSSQSPERGLTDYDIQNINMTVSYCIQHLRIKPEHVLLVGEVGKTSSASRPTSIPMACLRKPEYIRVDNDIFMDYLIPISTLGSDKAQTVLTDEYRKFYALSRAVQYATASFIILSILLSGSLGFNLLRYRTLDLQLSSLRHQNRDIESLLSEYDLAKKELERKTPLIRFVNGMNSSPSAARLLYNLSSLSTEGMDVQSLKVTSQGTRGLSLEMVGQMGSQSLYRAQKQFDGTISNLKEIEGIQDVGGSISLKDRSFVLTATFREEAAH
jgi:hypothetical protein